MTEAQNAPSSPDLGRRPFETDALQVGNTRIGVSSEGGYVTSWQIGGKDILYKGNSLKRTGIPILFPHYGEPNGQDAHGFARDNDWRVAVDDEKITMTLDSEHIGDEAKAKFPYPFLTQVVITPAADGGFTYAMSVINNGDTPFDISPGLHPYWAVPHGEKGNIRFENLGINEGEGAFDASNVDWDTNPPDTPYPYQQGGVTMVTPERRISIEDITQPEPVTGHIVLWSQPKSKEDIDFVCAEPVTRDDKAITKKRESQITVNPGVPWNMTIKFSSEPVNPQ